MDVKEAVSKVFQHLTFRDSFLYKSSYEFLASRREKIKNSIVILFAQGSRIVIEDEINHVTFFTLHNSTILY
jgi:hypothetical protein